VTTAFLIFIHIVLNSIFFNNLLFNQNIN